MKFIARDSILLVSTLIAAVSTGCGSTSKPKDLCVPNPCSEVHRGVCAVEAGNATCHCDLGFQEDAAGACVQEVTCDPACDSTQLCVDGICQEKPCDPACAPGTHCTGGACVDDPCDPACPADQHCRAGQCQENVCTPACLDGELCVDAATGICTCGASPSCPTGESCINGTCLDHCHDGIDNDGDGWTDAQDPDCLLGSDEVGFGQTTCNDGRDNDGDGLTDAADPRCTSALADEMQDWHYVRGSLASCLLNPDCHRVGIESHMGAWTASIPGNSMAAFQAAYDLGADAIETDVRVSMDGVPFMIHDDTITAYESLLCTGKVISQSLAADIESCLLVPSTTETIPKFDDFVEWARGKILIHLDVKDTVNLPVMVKAILDHGASDYAFIAVSLDDVANVLPTIPDVDRVHYVPRVKSVAAIDAALGPLRRPSVFMLEGDRSWDTPPVDETAMLVQIQRVQDAGLRIMASSDQYLPTVADHQHLFDMGFDFVQSYNTANGVAAAAAENAARGYPP